MAISQNLEYKFHNDNKSDYGDDQDKKSYISVKLEPKIADSNLSSPTGEDKLKRKGGAMILRQDNDFRYNDLTSNLMTKGDKKLTFE